MQTFKTVDEYLDSVPGVQRKTLEKIRQAIKAAAPGAEEVISYGIPMYQQNGSLGGFGAFKNHCSYFPASSAVMKEMAPELKSYKISRGTIQFPVDKPLPSALVKKMIKAKLVENESKIKTKEGAKQKDDEKKVTSYMKALKHPLKAEIDAVRKIIKNANPKIRERIKWNAPSYFTIADLVTFNPRATGQVHLVFHHPAIATIQSALFQGNFKGRKMIYFNSLDEIRKNKKELERIMNELVGKAAME